MVSEKDKIGLINLVLQTVKKFSPKTILNFPESDVIKNIAYDNMMKLPQHIDKPSLATVEYKKEEDPFLTTDYNQTVLEYLELEIYKNTGLSLNEYMRLTEYEIGVLKDMLAVRNSKLKLETEDSKRDSGNWIDETFDL